RNLTPYHVSVYLDRAPVTILPPCFGPSMIETPPTEFRLEAVASMPTAAGQRQMSLNIVPTEAGWDIVVPPGDAQSPTNLRSEAGATTYDNIDGRDAILLRCNAWTPLASLLPACDAKDEGRLSSPICLGFLLLLDCNISWQSSEFTAIKVILRKFLNQTRQQFSCRPGIFIPDGRNG